MQSGGHLQRGQFAFQLAIALGQRLPNGVFDAFVAQPDQGTRLAEVAGQATGLEDDGEHRLADAVALALAERAGGGQQVRLLLTRQGVQFLECIGHGCRQAGDVARCAAICEGGVGPQRAQHLDHVRLAASEEARDPGGGGFRAARQGLDVRFEDALDALFVVALANEGLQLEAQCLPLLRIQRFIDLCDALVLEREGIDVFLVNVSIVHFVSPLSLCCFVQAVMGVAR